MPVRAMGGYGASPTPSDNLMTEKEVLDLYLKESKLEAVEAAKAKFVEPELFESLEWLCDTPFSVHQFEEPPVITCIH